MTKKRFSKLYICIAVFVVILFLVFCPLQWTVAQATEPAGWQLIVRKIPFHKGDYLTYCILDFTLSPNADCYYKCTLSRRGSTVSSRTFAWPSYYPRNILVEFQDELPNGNRTAVIEFGVELVRCSWSNDQTIWKEVDTFYEGECPGMFLINPNKTRENDGYHQ